VDHGQLRQIEEGKIEPRLATQERLLKALSSEVPPEELPRKPGLRRKEGTAGE
jgi:hypothetical protein